MKKFEAKFAVTITFNGGITEKTVTKIIEARNLKSATNKAKAMEVYAGCRNYVGNLRLLESITEI